MSLTNGLCLQRRGKSACRLLLRLRPTQAICVCLRPIVIIIFYTWACVNRNLSSWENIAGKIFLWPLCHLYCRAKKAHVTICFDCYYVTVCFVHIVCTCMHMYYTDTFSKKFTCLCMFGVRVMMAYLLRECWKERKCVFHHRCLD